MKEALDEWESDEISKRALGKETAQTYTELEMREWKEYENHITEDMAEVTPWEIEKYLFS